MRAWLSLGALVALILAYQGGKWRGAAIEKTKCNVEVVELENGVLRDAVRRQSELARNNAGLALAADLRAQEAERRADSQTPKIEVRWRTVERKVEMSDDEIFEARVPVDVSRAFNCLLDPREGSGDCDGVESGAAERGDGEPSEQIPLDPSARTD